jgi:hypothetical protein
MGVFDWVSTGSVILRVADIDAAVDWYRANFEIEPLSVAPTVSTESPHTSWAG